MNVSINGEAEEITAEQLSVGDLLKLKDVESPDMVSVQLNGAIVDRDSYDKTAINDKDEVEFLYFMGGGAGKC